MKKFLIALLLFLFTSPCYATIVCVDGNYTFHISGVTFRNNEIHYTLLVADDNMYYKASISQNKYSFGMNIFNVYAFDKNDNYIHTDNNKEYIKTLIRNNKSIIGNNILTTFVKCKEDSIYLHCFPKG